MLPTNRADVTQLVESSIDTACGPFLLHILLDPARARKQPRLSPGEKMAAIELGRDVDGKVEIWPGRLHLLRIGYGAQEIPAKADKCPNRSVDYTLASFDCVQPLFGRRVETVQLLQLLDRREFRFLRDPYGPLPLDVAMAANGHRPRARLSDVPAQQEQVDHHPDILDPFHMLGEAHAVDAQHGLGSRIDARRLFQIPSGEA